MYKSKLFFLPVIGEVHATLLILDILVIYILESVCPSIGEEQTTIPTLHFVGIWQVPNVFSIIFQIFHKCLYLSIIKTKLIIHFNF